jgi:hypothetical protein
VREHWAPKDRGRLMVRIIEREPFYRANLPMEESAHVAGH